MPPISSLADLAAFDFDFTVDDFFAFPPAHFESQSLPPRGFQNHWREDTGDPLASLIWERYLLRMISPAPFSWIQDASRWDVKDMHFASWLQTQSQQEADAGWRDDICAVTGLPFTYAAPLLSLPDLPPRVTPLRGEDPALIFHLDADDLSEDDYEVWVSEFQRYKSAVLSAELQPL
ncbi:hypothetical protein B7R54_01740 [Subtercola boreus]|uniref:Uncharacterized protein n=1 Tax=Subtercola boreus TaxID=120213 RepID=A0A3E0VDT2_9MICO|nr:hypothetical protein [Subtercola boreus]RFA08076.1 hypothetical protein B7R54_01740 [Subtercola boreus]TQL55040.1 hypothetical protein FB464_2595 [Subtercola boreus]